LSNLIGGLLSKISRINSYDNNNTVGYKEAWVEDMFENLDKYPQIKAVIWWNGCDLDANGQITRSYFINEPQGLLKIFKDQLEFDK